MKTKYTTILTIIIFLSTIQLPGQCQEDIEIKTHPSNAVNDELDENHPVQSLYINHDFDWSKYTITGGNKLVSPILINSNAEWNRQFIPVGSGTVAFTSPFSSTMGTDYRYLWRATGIDPDELDWHWSDGWELMWIGLGNYPNGEGLEIDDPNDPNWPGIDPAHEASPYFVLYNRYTGKLRFFGNHYQELGVNSTAQNVNLELRMTSDNYSGILRHVSTYDQALDKETKNDRLFSNNKHPNSNRRFYSTDFQLGYDPCMCYYPSELTFWIQKNSDWEVNLHGRSITMNGTLDEYPPDFLTNRPWYRDSANSAFGGSLLYKNLSDLHDKYENELQDYESKLANYNKPQNQFARELINISKDLVKNGVQTAINPSAGAMNMVKDFMKNIGGIDENNEKEVMKSITKTADAMLGRGLDFMVKQYINPDVITKPVKPTMPTASFSEMRIGGSISHSSDYDLFTTFAPGSFKVGQPNFNLEPFNYPIYNKPTGLYALLKTPKVGFGNHNVDSSKTFFHG